MNKEGEKKKLPPKKPTAQKRDKQSLKRRMNNRMQKSRIRTAIRAYREAIQKNVPAEEAKQLLNSVFSILDKSSKKGTIKKNKASRLKSNLSLKMNKS